MLHQRLLSWFDSHKRDLPWRANRDPYHIWVSEVMLQQTQVATVIPYFKRFIERFPSLGHLAAAPFSDVQRAWQGLGYYRRASHMHQAAIQLVERHGNHPPSDANAWAGLPGIGRYTLGAILSQAFDLRYPVLEANTQRVLARLHGYQEDIQSTEGKKFLWRAAEELLPAKRIGDFNQALMELGALVCLPESPSCGQCPLHKWCVAAKENLQATIPVKSRKPEKISIVEAGAVIVRDSQVLMCQRPATGWWPGMWEAPHQVVPPGVAPSAAVQTILRDLVGLRASSPKPLTLIRHTVTHHRISLHCFEARWMAGDFRSTFYTDHRWCSKAELDRLALSSPQRRLLKAFNSPRQALLFE